MFPSLGLRKTNDNNIPNKTNYKNDHFVLPIADSWRQERERERKEEGTKERKKIYFHRKFLLVSRCVHEAHL
jgi:hypothetical protein